MIGSGKSTQLGNRDSRLELIVGDNGNGRGATTQFGRLDDRDGKGTTKSAGKHVPLIASRRGVVKSGRVTADLFSCVDFLPTVCQADITVLANIDEVSCRPHPNGE